MGIANGTSSRNWVVEAPRASCNATAARKTAAPMRAANLILISVTAGLLLVGGSASAQEMVTVRVMDPVSTVGIPDVEVHLRNLETSEVRTARTDAQGLAHFRGLSSAGQWQASFEGNAAFFEAASEPVEVRSTFELTVQLPLTRVKGAAKRETVVRAGGALLNATNAEVSSTLTSRQLERLPTEARTLDRALFRLPNVSLATGFFPEAPVVAINGANSLFTSYLIDGLDNNENFLGGQRFPVPMSIVQDVTVLAAGYSVEYGRTANGVVNVTTKSGGNTFHTEAFFLTRPGGVFAAKQATPPVGLYGNPIADNFVRLAGGALVSGPIVKDKTFFLADVEYTSDLSNNQLSVPQLGIEPIVPGNNGTLLVTARVDHRWNDRWTSTLRVNHGRASIERPGGGLSGGVTFPSAGSVQDRLSTNAAFTTTYAGDAFTYTGALQYGQFDWDYARPLGGAGPQLTVQDPSGQTMAVLGNPGYRFHDVENLVQTKHRFVRQLGNHRLTFGGDVQVSAFSLLGGGNPNGNLTVQLSDPQLEALRASNPTAALRPSDIPTDAKLLSANFETAPRAIGATQALVSFFVEDLWHVKSNFNLTGGLRWDYDSLSKGGAASGRFTNVGPRIGFNWSIDSNWVVRGGSGLFYEKLPYAVVSDAMAQSSKAEGFKRQLQVLKDAGRLPANTDLERITSQGNLSVDATDLCTGTQCPSGESLTARRDTLTSTELRILNPNGYQNPFAVQTTLGVQRKLLEDWLFSVDGIYTESFSLVRLVDVNAPAAFEFNQDAYDRLGPDGVAALSPSEREQLGLVRPAGAANMTRPALADGVVPAGGARSIIMSDTGGRSRYLALNVGVVRSRSSDFYDLRFHYTLSSLMNNTDDLNFRASDSNNFGADWGPSLNDRTHLFSAIVNVYPVKGLTLTVAGLVQSGTPVNYVPDARVFGTTDLNGDGLSFADQYTGNPDRFPGTTRNEGRLPWAVTVDVGASYALATAAGTFRLRLDVFNLLNSNTTSGYPVNFTGSNQTQLGGGAPFVQRSSGMPRNLQAQLQYAF